MIHPTGVGLERKSYVGATLVAIKPDLRPGLPRPHHRARCVRQVEGQREREPNQLRLIVTAFPEPTHAQRHRHQQIDAPAQAGDQSPQVRDKRLTKTHILSVFQAVYGRSNGVFKDRPRSQDPKPGP